MATALTIKDFITTKYKDYEVFPKSGEINIRQLPGTDAKIVSKVQLNVKAGTVMALYKTQKNGYNWYYIKLEKPIGSVKYGFIAGDVVTFKKVEKQTTPSTPSVADNKEMISKCQSELNKLLLDQKSVYLKLTSAYLILLNIKSGKVKANPDYDYQSDIQKLLKLKNQYIDLNNEIIKKQEVVKVIDITGIAIKDTSKQLLITYGENVKPYQGFLHGISLLGVIVIAAIAYASYELYNWLSDSREKSKTTGQSLDEIIKALKANGVSDSVIDSVKPVIEQQLNDTFDAGKEQGENSGLFGKFKTPLIILGSAALFFMILPYAQKGKDQIQKLRKKND